MWEAIAKWLQRPTEIEADLYPVDIHDWHRGTLNEWGGLKLSSRRLLVLMEKSEAWSPFKAIQPDGNWPEWMQMLKHLTNETALNRSMKYGSDGPEATVYLDPLERVKRLEEAVSDLQERMESEEQMYGEMGFS